MTKATEKLDANIAKMIENWKEVDAAYQAAKKNKAARKRFLPDLAEKYLAEIQRQMMALRLALRI